MRWIWVLLITAAISGAVAVTAASEETRVAAQIVFAVLLAVGLLAIVSYRRAVRKMREKLNEVASGGSHEPGPRP